MGGVGWWAQEERVEMGGWVGRHRRRGWRQGGEQSTGTRPLTFCLLGDPRVDVFPGLLCSLGKGKLLQLRVVELNTGVLERLQRGKPSVRLPGYRRCQQAPPNSEFAFTLELKRENASFHGDPISVHQL